MSDFAILVWIALGLTAGIVGCASPPWLPRVRPVRMGRANSDDEVIRLVSTTEPAEAHPDVADESAPAPFTEHDELAISPLLSAELARLPAVETREVDDQGPLAGAWQMVQADHERYYSAETLRWMGIGFGVGAAMANTSFDESFLHDGYAENVVWAPNHEFYERLHQPKILGDGWYTLPAFALAGLSEPLLGNMPHGELISDWGQISLRTVLVGGPPVLAAQWLTGGSRPGEAVTGSHWNPLQDDNGVSGHSFMGAIPFLSAAHISDNRWFKSGCYVASTLPALSRMNDDGHYPSQAFLGWWMAFVASRTIDHSHADPATVKLVPLSSGQSAGVGLEWRR